MRVLHIGNPWPVAALRELGHDVVEVFARFPELAVPGRPFDVAASAAALLEYVRLPEFAAQFHESIVGADPGDLGARRRLCAALFDAYRWHETRHHARVIAGVLGFELGGDGAQDRAEVDAEVGTVLRQRGNGERAVALLDRAAAVLPRRGALIAEQALAHVDVGDYLGAETCLRDGMRDVPEERGPLGELLALVHAVSGQPRPAPCVGATSGRSSPAPARCRP